MSTLNIHQMHWEHKACPSPRILGLSRQMCLFSATFSLRNLDVTMLPELQSTSFGQPLDDWKLSFLHLSASRVSDDHNTVET